MTDDDDRVYPLVRPPVDRRFTIGLVFDVLQVLVAHGYPDTRSGDDIVDLQQALFMFLYAEREE